MSPFALLRRDGADHVEVLTGDLVTVATLADIPLDLRRQTLAVIPYRQISERGFDCVDDGARRSSASASPPSRRPRWTPSRTSRSR